MQTRGYAREVLAVSLGAVGNGDVEAALVEHLARQGRWRVSAGYTHFLVAEQTLDTTVGGADTIGAQPQMLLHPLTDTAVLGLFPAQRTFTRRQRISSFMERRRSSLRR
ncbi:Scr1 family TA system antitoxin-like transcriptional regulator [Nocardia nova]|uniref:Scr1 family TA system antitoxin-like transcriptional regulator n=1 Tax=Nocardia nova TaxID=37330 RepID=UPI0033C4B421